MKKAIKKIKVNSMGEAHKIAMAVAFNSGRTIEAREMFGCFLIIKNSETVLAIVGVGQKSKGDVQ